MPVLSVLDSTILSEDGFITKIFEHVWSVCILGSERSFLKWRPLSASDILKTKIMGSMQWCAFIDFGHGGCITAAFYRTQYVFFPWRFEVRDRYICTQLHGVVREVTKYYMFTQSRNSDMDLWAAGITLLAYSLLNLIFAYCSRIIIFDIWTNTR